MAREQSASPSSPNVRRLVNKAAKAVMKSHRVALPKYDLPVRIRPWFLVFTCAVMLLLAFLGLTDAAHSLPLNDKFLHLTSFCVATGVFYFIFDVEEDARRIWFWRHASLIFTAIVCFFFGGLVSEIVQSMLPFKHFDLGDVAANVLGSAIGLYVSYHIEKHYRSRREIARLYRPLNTDEQDDGEYFSDDEAAKSTLPSKTKVHKADRLSDVWDEREELFGIGDDSEPEDPPTARPPSRTNGSPPTGHLPTITITRY